MPQLSKIRHEKFARAIAEGKSQTQAYIYAGYSENGAGANAARLIANDSIQQRISEITEAIKIETEAEQKDASIGVFKELDKLIRGATALGQYDAVYRAITLKAKLKGLL